MKVFTVEQTQLQTTILLNALNRAKQTAGTIKKACMVYLNGQPYCSVSKGGKIILN